jgi:acyl-CoA synthetase (AMP-forming)/AMP-acid ligase II
MSSAVSPIPDLMRRWADERGEAVAFRFLADGAVVEQCLTFRELFDKSRALARRLLLTCSPCDRVALLLPASLDFVVGLYAAMQAGLIAVPLQAPHPRRIASAARKLAHVFDNCQPKVVLTTDQLMVRRNDFMEFSWSFATARWQTCAAAEDDAKEPTELPPVGLSQVALLQYTSGSTSEPKGVILTHENLAANQAMLRELDNLSVGQTGLANWLPHYHDMGLAVFLFAVFQGIPATFMSPAHFIQRPVRWLEMLSRYRATVTCCPNFALDLAVERAPAGEITHLDLSALRCLILGAEPLSPQSIEAFIARFAPIGLNPEAITACYGLAESTVLASGTPRRPPRMLDVKAGSYGGSEIAVARPGDPSVTLVSCGKTGSGHELVICDQRAGTVLREGEIGEIWLKGKSIGNGYWDLAEVSERVFDARTVDGQGPFLRTGDLGFLWDGEVYVSGRIKDLIIIRGRNIYPQDIERLIEEDIADVAAAAAFSQSQGEGERVVVVAEMRRHTKRRTDEISADIKTLVLEDLEIDLGQVVIVAENAIPKTSSGKVRRQHCKAILADGSLQNQGRRAESEAVA